MKSVLILAFLFIIQYPLYGYDEFEVIMNEIRYYNENIPQDSDIKTIMDGLRADGSFVDIDYSIKSRINWEPKYHYKRLLLLCKAYTSPTSKWFSDDILYSKIERAVNYWTKVNPSCDNWWSTQIEEPQYFGLILIIMRNGYNKLPMAIENKIVKRWKSNGSNPAKQVGANKSDIALHWLYFACLTRDPDLLSLSCDFLFEPIKFTDGWGFQVDNSYFFHGNQLFICGYGETQMIAILQAALFVRDTGYRLNQEQLSFLRDYVMRTWANAIRGQYIYWNCTGRGISIPDYLKDSDERISILNLLIELDPEYEDWYKITRDRLFGIISADKGVATYHTYYYCSDYTQHVSPRCNYSVRMVSKRTCRQETAYGENVLGYYVSDGSTCITSRGDEYYNILPLWDWNYIPGVTTPIMDSIPMAPNNWSVYGVTDFAGGVGDSISGCSAYRYFDDYNNINTGACKGYFFFDEEMLCLGTGIRSDKHTVTTVNQCWGGQKVFCGDTKEEITEFIGTMDDTLQYNKSLVLHDGIGYYFPNSQRIIVKNREIVGNWRWISAAQDDNEILGRVFTLYVDHETPNRDADYSYVVRPCGSFSELKDYVKNCPLEVLTNTDSVQVVRHKQLKMTECIFYKPCIFYGNDITIQSSHPCTMLIKECGAEFLVYISDPIQSRQDIEVGIQTINSKEMSFGKCEFSELDELHAGMTKIISLRNSSSIKEIDDKVKFTLSKKPYFLIFDKPYHGSYRLFSIEGKIIDSGYVDGRKLQLDIIKKGVFFIDLRIDNSSRQTVKLIAD